MKVSISVPDSLFDEAEELSERLGVTRSGLYRRAIEALVLDNREEELIRRINEVCADVNTSLPPDLEQATVAMLHRVKWDE